MLLIWFLGWGGRIREVSGLVPGILDEARSRGDVYTLVMIRSCARAYLADLAADDPDRAIDETSHVLAQWSQTRYDFPHFSATFAGVECDLYAGRFEQARNRVVREWAAMKHSLLSAGARRSESCCFTCAAQGWHGRALTDHPGS
jgi:hypothetical protein